MADNENQELIERIEKLETINKELKEEKTELKAKYKGVDVEEFLDLKRQNAELESKYAKLEKANGILTKDYEKANEALADREKNLDKLIIDDGIAKALNTLEKHKLNDGALELALLDIKSKGVSRNEDGVPMVGDKALNDFIANDWLSSPTSKNLVTPNENSGGGATGSKGDSGGANIDTKNMTPDQKMRVGREA